MHTLTIWSSCFQHNSYYFENFTFVSNLSASTLLISTTMSVVAGRGGTRGAVPEGGSSAARCHDNRPRLINCRNMYDPLPALEEPPPPAPVVVTAVKQESQNALQGANICWAVYTGELGDITHTWEAKKRCIEQNYRHILCLTRRLWSGARCSLPTILRIKKRFT